MRVPKLHLRYIGGISQCGYHWVKTTDDAKAVTCKKCLDLIEKGDVEKYDWEKHL